MVNAAPTSYDEIVAGGDAVKKSLLQKKETSFNYITSKILKEQQQQKLAALHYGATNTWFLFAPTILITLGSAVLSILIQSPLVSSDNAKAMIALTITVFQLLLSLFQSLAKQLNLGGKAGFHQSASTSLRKIHENALYSVKEAKYQSIYTALKMDRRPMVSDPFGGVQSEIDKEGKSEEKKDGAENPKPTSGSSEEKKSDDAKEDDKEKSEKTDSMESITQQFHQAVGQVDSPIPMNISAAFNMLESRINIINKSLLRDKKSAKIAWEKIFPAAYFQLSETIIKSRGWPLILPDPKWSVERALKDLKYSLRVSDDNNADLLNELVIRAETISSIGDRLRDKTKPILPKTGSDIDTTMPLKTV